MAERSVPPILLVRLRPLGPDGTVVGESRRVCHLVPVPQAGDVPEMLRAYCGQEIPPGAAELLGGMTGMPCEPCLARSPIPAFAMLRTLPAAAGAESSHSDVAAWWDLGLLPEQKITARFVLLILLQDLARYLSVGEIALWLGTDAHAVNLIMLLHAAVGWVEPAPDQAVRAWVDRSYRLTGRGATLARRMLARGLTETFTLLANRLGLDISVASDPDTTDPDASHATTDPEGDEER